ncbi:MAG: hypothetical protein ACOYNY_46225 [Caldilineaceae bacterium]
MSGVNPFNFASWNLGGLNWNAWGEPNEGGLDDAPPVTTTPPPPPPPPAQATDTVTIGSNFTSALGTYQPPNGWSQADIADLYDLYNGTLQTGLTDPVVDDSYLSNWAFWLTTEDIFPAARTGVLTDEQALAVDYDAWNNSVAKQIGVGWPKYQQAVEAARFEMQNTPSQAEQSGGSYSFSLSPSDRVSNWSNHPGVLPTITSSEAERINRIIDQYPARFQTKEALISALSAGGFFKADSISGGSSGPDAEGRDQTVVKLKRLWVDMRMSNYRTAQADAGGVQDFGLYGVQPRTLELNGSEGWRNPTDDELFLLIGGGSSRETTPGVRDTGRGTVLDDASRLANGLQPRTRWDPESLSPQTLTSIGKSPPRSSPYQRELIGDGIDASNFARDLANRAGFGRLWGNRANWQHHPSGGIHTFKGSDAFQVTLRSAANSKSGASAVEVKWHGVTVRWHVVDK